MWSFSLKCEKLSKWCTHLSFWENGSISEKCRNLTQSSSKLWLTLTSLAQTGLAWRQCVKSFLFYYYYVRNAIFEFWSIPSSGLWVFDVFCKRFGFKQISDVSVKPSVNVNGNDFREVDLDDVTVEKKPVSMKHPFKRMLKLVGCFCEWMHIKRKTWVVALNDRCVKVQIIYSHSLRPCLYLD